MHHFCRGGGGEDEQNPFFGGQLGQKPILFFSGGGGGTFGHSPLHIGEYIIVFLVLGSSMNLYQIINIKTEYRTITQRLKTKCQLH